uniref:Lebercilin domain-containing protein n=1 Tax=Syphacia muris TaxID=451379 RepID=A0A0N5ASA9_9BILA
MNVSSLRLLELVEHNAKNSSNIALLKSEVDGKEKELNNVQAFCKMKNDKISRLMQHTQIALMRKAEAEIAYVEETNKMKLKRKKAEELFGRIREEVLDVTAILDKAPWVQSRQQIISKIVELKEKVNEKDVAIQDLELELNEKIKIIDGHKKMPFQIFCKTAALLALRIRDLLSNLAHELIIVNKLREAQSAHEIGANSVNSSDQTGQSMETVDACTDNSVLSNNAIEKITPVEKKEEPLMEKKLLEKVCSKSPESKSHESDDLSIDGNILQEFKRSDPEKRGRKTQDAEESLENTLNLSSLETSTFSFNQKEKKNEDVLDDVEDVGVCDEPFRAPSLLKSPQHSSKTHSKKRREAQNGLLLESGEDLLGFRKAADSEVAQFFGNAGLSDCDFNISQLESNSCNDFNPSALLDLSGAVQGCEGNTDFMSLFGGTKSGTDSQEDGAFSFDFNAPLSIDDNESTGKLLNQPFSLF